MIITFALILDQDGSNRHQSHYYIADPEIKLELKIKRAVLTGIAGIIGLKKIYHQLRKLSIKVIRSRFLSDTARENNPPLASDIKIVEDYYVKNTNGRNTFGRNLI